MAFALCILTPTSAEAISLDFPTPVCHSSRFKLTSAGYPPEVAYEAYNLAVTKESRIYRIYGRGKAIYEDPFNSSSQLWAHGCGGDLARVEIPDSNSDYATARFIFPGSTLFLKLNDRGRSVETRGEINVKYGTLGFEKSILKLPLNDETRTPNKPGAFNHFQGGSIYWSPTTGAHEIHGAIRDKWAAMGWENSALGFPTTDETRTPNKPGAFNHFQGGSIYWSPTTGAHEIHGAIRDKWAAMG
uniref:LGFP repeat-containing protein n=1 Tax=Streptomyces hayashii TaxID=2839966 RepID=UPI00403C0465